MPIFLVFPTKFRWDLTIDAAKINDFGLARVTATHTDAAETVTARTEPGVVMGTVGYMSPEQVPMWRYASWTRLTRIPPYQRKMLFGSGFG